MNLTRTEFELLIQEAWEAIPASFRRRLGNVALTLAEEPLPSQLRELGLRRGETLLGLYEGVPLPERGADFGNALPDKITLFRRPLLEASPDLKTLREEIRQTVWHEVGHFFGLTDPELRRLERAARANLRPEPKP